MPSLHEIQETVSTLWLNREAREWLLGGRKTEPPQCLRGADQEILNTVDLKGIELYAELLAYGYADVMKSVYPYCSKLLDKEWDRLVEDYVLKCPPEHYNFNHVCDKFPQYLSLYCEHLIKKHPFLAELADYEWVEMEKIQDSAGVVAYPHQPLTSPEQIASWCPVVNATLTIREYKYNILEISNDLDEGNKVKKKTSKPEQTLIAIYRRATTHHCQFAELGDTAAQIVEIARRTQSYQSLIPHVVSLMPEESPQDAVVQFLELVEDLQELGIFVGLVPVGS